MKAFLSVLILLSLLLPAICYAEWEYITHGGYDAAVGAWTRTALIFSDSNYKGLFISAIVLGAIAIFVATYVRAATGAKAGGLSWATPVLAGMAIYVAFIAPKDKLIIYDELLNRGPQEVGGIPLILATSAGILNKIEKGFTDIISTSTDPVSDYRMNAGGTGWSLLDAVTPASVLPPNPYSTVQRFIKDCVYPELIRDGTVLDINKIARGEQKYDVVITESANPALYTVVYTDNGAGTTKTCYDAAPDVALILGNPTYGDLALKTICASKGFNTSGPSLNVCKNLIDSILTTTFPGSTGGNISFGVFLAQKVLADAFMQVAEQSSSSVAITTLATSQTQSQFIGLGLHANTWIPVLKESLTAVAISITPLLLLFAATPLANRALSLVFGMFVWLTMWGIIDAVIHAFGVDLAKQASQTIQVVSGDMGFTAMFMWPSYTAKVAATFGALRWSGLMLASVISGMLVKFGGTALAMLAGSISAMPQSSGAAYGGTLLKHADRVVSGEIMPTQTWSNAAVRAGGIRALTDGLVQKQAGEMVSSARFGNRLGAGMIAQATEGSLMGSAASGLGTGMAIDRHGLESLTSARFVEIASAIGSGMAKQEIANRFFGGDNAKAEYAMSRLEALRRYGVYDAYQKGIANEQDFIDFGIYHTKAQAGDVNAMKAIENITGKDFKDVQREIKQAGLEDSFQSAVVTARIAQNLGIDRFSYFGQKHGLQNIALNEQMAQRLNQQMHLLGYKNFNAKAGDIASFSFDPSTGRFGLAHTKRGGASEFYDFKSALRGRQDVFKDLTVVEKGYREQSGTFVTRGVSVTQINEPYKFVGVYTTPDGTVMHGNFSYVKDKEGNWFLVSGSGSDVTVFTQSDQFIAPDGERIDVVKSSVYGGGGRTLLKSQTTGGSSTFIDVSKTLKGGWVYDNYVGAVLDEVGKEEASRAWGIVNSVIGSPTGGLFIKRMQKGEEKLPTKNK